MGVAIRVIPCLDVDAGRVVKGVNFANLRDAGDPVEQLFDIKADPWEMNNRYDDPALADVVGDHEVLPAGVVAARTTDPGCPRRSRPRTRRP